MPCPSLDIVPECLMHKTRNSKEQLHTAINPLALLEDNKLIDWHLVSKFSANRIMG